MAQTDEDINMIREMNRIKEQLRIEAAILSLKNHQQVGGNHYSQLKIDPYEYCFVNNIGPLEFNVIKYVSRWRQKNGIEDLKKAIHTLERLIKLENARL